MAPPPAPLLDWRVPEEPLLAVVSVSRLRLPLDRLRLPAVTGFASPAPIATAGMPIARISAQTSVSLMGIWGASWSQGLRKCAPPPPGRRATAFLRHVERADVAARSQHRVHEVTTSADDLQVERRL